MEFLNLADTLKFAVLGCTLCSGFELARWQSSPKGRSLYTLIDLFYLISCATTCAAFLAEGYGLLQVEHLCAFPKQPWDVFFCAVFLIATVFMCVLAFVRRQRGACTPGISCTVHAVIFTALVSDLVSATEALNCDEECGLLHRYYSLRGIKMLVACTFLSFGNFIFAGLAYRPSERTGKEQHAVGLEIDDCSFFGRVSVTVIYKHLWNSARKTFHVEDLPRLIPRLQCSLQSERESENLIKRAADCRSGRRFYISLLRDAWWEHFWSGAATLLNNCMLLLRIPLFSGLLGESSSSWCFNQSVLLLCASCLAECLVSSVQSYFLIRTQLRTQLILHTAVFKKVARLSSAALTENPSGHVCTLLAADSWLVGLATCYFSGCFVGLACIPVILAVTARQMGYASACACLVWMVFAAAAAYCIFSSLGKCYAVFYKHRDSRLKKFTDLLASIRFIKISALEDIFEKSLLRMRLNEIAAAFRISILESVLDTIISASSSMMIMAAFCAVSLTQEDAVFSPATMYSCVYALTLVDVFMNTMPQMIRLQRPALRSCRRLMSFFAAEEFSSDISHTTRSSEGVGGELTMKDCSFSWAKRDSELSSPILTGINLHIEVGSVIGVVGAVGSGKSSLLSAVAGEMRCLEGDVRLNGSTAVLPQTPRVLNMTLRDNITFGRKFDEAWYNNVLEACQLVPDIRGFPGGDLTQAGDQGEMLSGGQKQRVALARALYSRSDIYLLDDPTSSQDAGVRQRILRNVLGPGGILSGKTCFLVTNSARLPFHLKRWILMHKTALQFNDFKKLSGYAELTQALMKQTKPQPNFPEPVARKCEPLSLKKEATYDIVKEEGMFLQKGLIEVTRAYFRYSGVSMVLSVLCFAASAAFLASQLICIKTWAALMMNQAEDAHDASRVMTYWLAAFCLGDVASRLAAGVLLAQGTKRSSLRLHEDMLARLCGSPLAFFDATPRGRILNRFSVDLEMNDTRIFVAQKQLFQNIFAVLARMAVIGSQALVVFVLTCVAGAILIVSLSYCVHAAVLGRLYESTRLSRLLQHLSETLGCVALIRSYGVVESFCALFRRLLNTYHRGFYLFVLCYSFSRLLIAFCGMLVILLTVVIVVTPSHGDPASTASVGLSLLSSLTVPFALTGIFIVIFWSVQGNVALKRVLEYTELPTENPDQSKLGSPKKGLISETTHFVVEPYDDSWPSCGVVKFEHFSASYHIGIIDNALKDISFEARAGEKVAIVGRTGAGKSSLVLALLRMIQRSSGRITIDGRDIHHVSLKRLRSVISVIHQEPSLWGGTLRENLDPRETSTDAELWRVVRRVHLHDMVENNPKGLFMPIGEKGENLSCGQRQLVSLARALLRGTKILVLDEATSQMDPDTDRKVQQTLRDNFSHCTLITIAHRLDTILDYDRVVVMGDGRVLESGSVHQLLADKSSAFYSMVLAAGMDAELKCQKINGSLNNPSLL